MTSRAQRRKQAAKVGCLALILSFLVFEAATRAEDSTWLYTVQISATVQVSPPRIMLSWHPDEYGVNNFVIYRKSKTATSWGEGTMLSGTTTNFVDNNVVSGATYEYQIIKNATRGYTGYGYIYAGINAPLTDDRGKVVLLVATNATSALSFELGRLQSDLNGDGWRVMRHDVSSNDTPSAVKSLIVSDYQYDPGNVQAVFLFGHVPILQSANLNYDGHQDRPMPADAFYGDMDGNWPTDSAHSPGFLPSDVELMVGRVDFFNMPGNGAPVAWPTETELLRNYLNKDHNWRHKLIQVNRRALMGNLRGDEAGEATAASGYRNFEPLVGPGNTIEAGVEYSSLPAERWISRLAAGNYLWAYGCGAGMPAGVSGLGIHDGTFYDVWSTDIVGQDAQAVFVMLFGSWFGQWDVTDDLMRSVLATPTMGLTCCMAGRPHWFVHHMGLGETIGYGTRLTMNNSTLYRNQSNNFTRAVYIALMGDPTLRMDQVAPPGNLHGASGPEAMNLTWSGSSDSVVGYHVYRSVPGSGDFMRLTPAPITQTAYSDYGVSPGNYTYMVRAVKLETTPSGTFYNGSQGTFATVTVNLGPINLQVAKGQSGIVLTWNSVPGATYHVQVRTALNVGNWTDLSGTITASGPSTWWTDAGSASQPQRFYRISSQ